MAAKCQEQPISQTAYDLLMEEATGLLDIPHTVESIVAAKSCARCCGLRGEAIVRQCEDILYSLQ
jgi:hypothetical protein